MTDDFAINSHRGDAAALRYSGGTQTGGMRDAADESRRPNRLAVIRYAQCKPIDAVFVQRTPCAQSSGGELLDSLRHRAAEVRGFRGQKQRRVPRSAHFGDHDVRVEQTRQERRQI
jgi:hypothetical protein